LEEQVCNTFLSAPCQKSRKREGKGPKKRCPGVEKQARRLSSPFKTKIAVRDVGERLSRENGRHHKTL